MRLPLPWKDRTLLCFLSWRTRPRIKKRMSSLVNFSFNRASSPYVIRRYHISLCYGKKPFFHHRSPADWRYGQRNRSFRPPRIPAVDMARNLMYLLWFEHRTVFTPLGSFFLFFKKNYPLPLKTRVGKWMVDFNVIIDSFSDPTTPRERNFFH